MSHSILFTNNSKMSILLETWMELLHNNEVHKLYEIVIHPQENVEIYSSTGEWYIHHRFEKTKNTKNARLNQEWFDFYKSKTTKLDDNKILIPYRLGKFRDKPCIQGDFCWIESEYFQAKYVDGVIIFEECV